ncbi:MAG: transcription antiterminator, partial [Atopostipes suicloacalis]|nr:transcription antiterminator [Atopostipes suicloacalis]
MLNQKEIQILRLFFDHPSDYLTSEEIGKHIGVSDKTTRKYLKELDGKIDSKIAKIEAVRGYGNQLNLLDERALLKLMQEEMQSNELKSDSTDLNTPDDRKDYLLRALFFEERSLYFEELLNELYISEPLLLRDIAQMRKLLKEYSLELSNRKEEGLLVHGKEQDKRHFIMGYFLVNQYQNSQKSFEQIARILKGVHLEEILIIVLDEYRNQYLNLNDTIILNVAVHIALALVRVQKGYPITSSAKNDCLKNSREVKAAKNIIRRLKNTTSLTLPEEEVYNIALHLKNKQSLEYMLSAQNIKKIDLENQIIEALQKIEDESNYSYSKDKRLIQGIIAHFVPLLMRVENKEMIQNPFLEEIQNNYPIIFKQIKESFSEIPVIKEAAIVDDEWAYIALHVIAARERKRSREKTKVLVICATGLGSSQMIAARLKNELASKIQIKEIISYYEISEEKLEGVALIISTIDLSNTVFNLPIVNVSVLLNEKDIQKINQHLSSVTQEILKEDRTDTKVADQNKIEEIIDEYFDAELFICSEKIKDKEEGLSALISKSVAQDNG